MSDPYSANTVLLLHMEGENDSTNIINSIAMKSAIPNSGDVKISTAQSKWGKGSGSFNNNYLILDNSLISNEDYTIELWVYLNSYSSNPSWGCYFVSQYNNGIDFNNRFLFGLKENGNKKLYVFRGGDGELLGTSDLPLTTWTHVAISRSGDTRYLFVNGGLENQGVTTGSLSSANTVIGAAFYSGYQGVFNGYMQDVRITRGVARYTGNFTPPTTRVDDPDPLPIRTLSSAYSIDREDGGVLSIVEPVTRMNSPVSRRVRLCDQRSGRLVREQWSDPATGLVTFADLREGPWLLYALDHTGEFEAVAISDRVATADGARP